MSKIPLGLYLWKRIHEVGVDSIFGVPGDFNLNFLDYIYEVPGLKWIGNANELNAAYAADGYARVKEGPACLVTTHGVGELSALNGIAGAASEHSPVIHVVGQTRKIMQDNNLMIHHSIGSKPDHQVYQKTSSYIRAAAAELWDVEKAPVEIDRVIRECLIQKQPVYIFFPVDLTAEQVDASLLERPIDISPPVNSSNEEEAIQLITERLSSAKNPAVFVDLLVHSHGKKEARKLVDVLKIPIYASHMAKSIIDEDHPRFVGLHNGNISFPGVSEAIQECDFVLALSWWPADTNSGGFTRRVPPEKRIDIMDSYVMIDGKKKLENVYMAPLLSKLADALSTKSGLAEVQMPSLPQRPSFAEPQEQKITQKYVWIRLGEFLKPGDVVLSDTGTAGLGLPDATFPKNVTYFNQTYYGSIGWATPAAFGADVALNEIYEADKSKPRGRTVLITGDGSLQLTINEIGSMVTHGTQPLIIIINNAGYTIERAIHGARATYNDINRHNYSYLLHLFGAENPDKCFRRASTRDELEKALGEQGVREPKEVQVLEVVMDKLDIPWRLMKVLESREGMREYFEEEGFTGGL